MWWRNRCGEKARSPDAYRKKQVTQLSLWNPVASVDAYGKVVCYDVPIAGKVKHGSEKNEQPCEVQILTHIEVTIVQNRKVLGSGIPVLLLFFIFGKTSRRR